MNLPNKLTVLRIFLIPVFMLIIIFGGNAHVEVGSFTVYWNLVFAAIVFAIASITDWFDGRIARG
ncbi:CDP-alcohol phosphatidyltransferase family protein, partial [Lactobacillus acetotolerans]|nr:CDP-diacylglycerol--glycerol-3-phosphate 3-phosphatidyltransferase [Lactobacillus acetotolerans]